MFLRHGAGANATTKVRYKSSAAACRRPLITGSAHAFYSTIPLFAALCSSDGACFSVCCIDCAGGIVKRRPTADSRYAEGDQRRSGRNSTSDGASFPCADRRSATHCDTNRTRAELVASDSRCTLYRASRDWSVASCTETSATCAGVAAIGEVSALTSGGEGGRFLGVCILPVVNPQA